MSSFGFTLIYTVYRLYKVNERAAPFPVSKVVILRGETMGF